jgi:hypothetical protein
MDGGNSFDYVGFRRAGILFLMLLMLIGLVSVIALRTKQENQSIYSVGVGTGKFAEFGVMNLFQLVCVNEAPIIISPLLPFLIPSTSALPRL